MPTAVSIERCIISPVRICNEFRISIGAVTIFVLRNLVGQWNTAGCRTVILNISLFVFFLYNLVPSRFQSLHLKREPVTPFGPTFEFC